VFLTLFCPCLFCCSGYSLIKKDAPDACGYFNPNTDKGRWQLAPYVISIIDVFQTALLFPLAVVIIFVSETPIDVFVNVVALQVFGSLDDIIAYALSNQSRKGNILRVFDLYFKWSDMKNAHTEFHEDQMEQPGALAVEEIQTETAQWDPNSRKAFGDDQLKQMRVEEIRTERANTRQKSGEGFDEAQIGQLRALGVEQVQIESIKREPNLRNAFCLLDDMKQMRVNVEEIQTEQANTNRRSKKGFFEAQIEQLRALVRKDRRKAVERLNMFAWSSQSSDESEV